MDQEISETFTSGCLILNMIFLSLLVVLKKKSFRRWWVRPLNRTRERNGYLNNLFEEMKTRDHEEFFSFTRMWPCQFGILLELVTPYLIKKSRRQPLDSELRLALTLSYLAHADSVQSKAWQFRIGRSTAYKIIPETCQAIYKALQPTYLPSMNQRRWGKVAKGYDRKWQFPNCLGALDGKHIMIRAPRNSGSQFYNYKKKFSIVLMATCDAQYRFTWIDVGQYGSMSDGGVWGHADLSSALSQNAVDLPPPKKLPGSDKSTHFAFVADAAFPLSKFLITPYPGEKLLYAERIFNYRVSRARRCIENAFTILASRFRILLQTLAWNPSDSTTIVNAVICLHNFIMFTETSYPKEKRWYSKNTDWRRLPGVFINDDISRNSRIAVQQRDILRDYFVSPMGSHRTPWQYSYVYRGYNINR